MSTKKQSVPVKETGTRMRLTVKDRLIIKNLYPKQSSLMEQIIAADIELKIKISQEEMKKIGLQQVGDSLRWNEGKDKAKEIRFSEAEVEFLKNRIKDLDEKKQITVDMVSFCKLVNAL